MGVVRVWTLHLIALTLQCAVRDWHCCFLTAFWGIVPQDVILPRVLDDGTFATLSSLMLFNNVEVLMALTQDKRFFPELFGRLKELSGGPQKGDAASDQAWTDLVAFLQVGAAACSAQMPTGPRILRTTTVHGEGRQPISHMAPVLA